MPVFKEEMGLSKNCVLKELWEYSGWRWENILSEIQYAHEIPNYSYELPVLWRPYSQNFLRLLLWKKATIGSRPYVHFWVKKKCLIHCLIQLKKETL